MDKSVGTYTILTPTEHLQEQILVIERAGRTCYRSEDRHEITQETAAKFCRMLIARGHESVLEHSCMTVCFSGHSRGFTHELVRHRIAAFSQESTRYVDYALEAGHDIGVVCPPGLMGEQRRIFEQAADAALNGYRALRGLGVPAQDARQLLPIGVTSEIVMSANFREWRHVFSLRCARPAHWEIRRTMAALLVECRGLLPGVFDDFERVDCDGDGVDYWRRVNV